MKKTLPITVITGPTASGKTSLAIELAKKIDAEIISADSRIIYKDLDIVSAKPKEEEKEGIIHHLIDIKTVDDGVYSAGDFVKDAKKAIEKIKSEGKNIIIQGGTWFYIKSLLDEKSLIEFGQDKNLREKLNKLSNDELYEILKSKDEKRAELVHKNNRDKIIRSIELIELTGMKLSEYKRKENEQFDAVWFMKDITREELYEKINLRTDLMIKEGLYFEWEQNIKKYKNHEILYNTIGYREFFDLKEGVYKSFNEAIDKIKQHTRNFAKRQLTWFRQNEAKLNIHTISSLQDVTKYL